MTPKQRKNNVYSLVNPYTRTKPKTLYFSRLETIEKGIEKAKLIATINCQKHEQHKRDKFCLVQILKLWLAYLNKHWKALLLKSFFLFSAA